MYSRGPRAQNGVDDVPGRTWRRGGPSTAFLLLVGVGVAWGTIGVAAEQIRAGSDLDAFAVNWLRTVIAAPILLVVAWRESGRALPQATRTDLTVMAALGVVIVVTNLLYLVAVGRAGVAPATLVALCVPPVLIAATAATFLGERLAGRAALALGGAVAGTALLVGWDGGATGGAFLGGILIAFACAALIALFTMVSRTFAGRHPASRPLAVGFTVGAAALAPVAVARGVPLDHSAETWGLLVYLAVVPSVVAYWMYQRALRDVAASTASVVTLLEPLVATVLAWWLFGERLGWSGLVGGVVLCGSIALLSSAQPAMAAAATATD